MGQKVFILIPLIGPLVNGSEAFCLLLTETYANGRCLWFLFYKFFYLFIHRCINLQACRNFEARSGQSSRARNVVPY